MKEVCKVLLRAVTVALVLVAVAVGYNLVPAARPQTSDRPFGGVKLLEGYRYKRSGTVDTINGRIYKEGGLSIEFESGVSEGFAADPKKREKYLSYREHVVNGHRVMVALTRSGAGTVWEPEHPRGPRPRKILMVTFPGSFGPDDAANFYAEVLDEQEIIDTLLMAFTFDPDK